MSANPDLAIANAHLNARRLPDAERAFRQIVSHDPSAPAWNGLGISLAQQGRLSEAEPAFRRAIQLQPYFIAAYQNLANCCKLQKHFADAEAAYRALVTLAPANAQTYDDLVWVLLQQKKIVDAIPFMQKAMQLQPANCNFRHHLAVLFYELQQLDTAAEVLTAALAIEPNHVACQREMAKVLWQQQHFEEALAAFNRILDPHPDDLIALRGRAELLLQMGDYEKGWRDYERRWDDPEFLEFIKLSEHRPRGFEMPKWSAEDLAGKTILLFAEQGFGDAIQFIRFAPLLAQRRAKVILECSHIVRSLLQQAPSIAQIYVHGEKIPPCDFYIPLMSLPHVLGTTLATVPADVPYLRLPKSAIEYWQRQLADYAGAFKIGLCWAGRPEHPNDLRRSCSLNDFAVLANIPNVTFFSLQKGPAAAQIQNPPTNLNLINLSHKLSDFLDTAGLIQQLDLVISVDTSIVHLAGALAKPVWTLLPFSSEWRWLTARNDSPWYPTMRLFRQPAPAIGPR